MKTKEMERVIAHFNKYFEQSDPLVYHTETENPHVDVLVYPPAGAYPFWKLVSMGASDFAMPEKKPELGDRNEYILQVGPEEDLTDRKVLGRYAGWLLKAARFAAQNHCYVTDGHSLEWKSDEGEAYCGAELQLPEFVKDSRVLYCRLGLLKFAVCLQVRLLTKEEIDAKR